MICLYLVVALFSCDLAQSSVPLWYKEIESLLADDLPNDKKMVVATREGVEYTGTFSEIEDFLKSDLSKGQEMVYNHNFKREDIERVFPPDRRRQRNPRTFPFSAMGRIELGCTGTFISRHVVLTAAHCVYEGGYLTDLEFYRGKDCGDHYLSKHDSWSRIYTYPEWRLREDDEYDIAWIVYDRPSPIHVRYTSHMPHTGSQIFISGYPGDKGPQYCLWGSSDPLLRVRTRILQYRVDTARGQSGSSIIYYGRGRRPSPVIIGVHSSGNLRYNEGVRMTRENKRQSDNIIRTHG